MQDMPPIKNETTEQEGPVADPSRTPASRFSALQFLICFILFMCISPLFDDFPQGSLVESLLLTLVLLSAVPAVGGGRRTFVNGLLWATPAIAARWLHHFRPDAVPLSISQTFGIMFAAFIVVQHLLYIFRAKEVDGQVLSAGISTFLMLGLLWGFCYLLLDQISPHSFDIQMDQAGQTELSGFAGMYFSLGILSGLGMNDVSPASDMARMLALLESMVSVFYLAILISRLVSMHMERSAGLPLESE